MLCRRNASTNITTLVSSHHSCVVVDINTGHLKHGHNQTKSNAEDTSCYSNWKVIKHKTKDSTLRYLLGKQDA